MVSIVLFFGIVFSYIVSGLGEDSCHTQFGDSHLYLATKTPYRIVANVTDNVIKYPGCRPYKLFGIVRHGTRTPGKKFVKIARDNLNWLRDRIIIAQGKLCGEEKESFKSWSLQVENEDEKILTREGAEEMLSLAERYQSRFPQLFQDNFHNDSYLFKYTKTQRTEESAKSFTLGLFGKNHSNVWFPQPLDEDPILRFYKVCEGWQRKVKKNPASRVERKRYIESEEMRGVLGKISDRLGLDVTLSFDVVHTAYVICSFETAWSSASPSPWCSLFSEHDLQVLEYGEELKYYWRDGYGYDINHNQACPLIANVISQFRDDDGDRRIVVYFTHSGTLLKTLSHLGLYRDSFILTHGTEPLQREARLFRSSRVNTFANNLIFVLFTCSDGLQMLTLHQERVVRLPSCPQDTDLCPFDIVQQVLTDSASCQFDNICSMYD